ncbi:hypothetical protein LguiA_025610 [Lonicera macranthoides]
MATQTSFSSNSAYSYDVFLSFRGIDTRRNFTDHLYKALKQAGVETFRDDDEIPRGENINFALERAIKQSRMSIIIFSKEYTSSNACLYEVKTILEHSKHSKHTILPIFYHVEPAELKQKARDLAPVLTKEYQKGWSTALEEVASMAGMPLKDQYESDFISQIVELIESKLSLKALTMGRHLIGMDYRVEGINLWLKDRSSKNMLVICGMGGLGKTTVAKFVYNSNYQGFDASCFLGNIADASKDPKKLVSLQRQLLEKVQRKPEKKFYDIDDGHGRIQCAVKNKRVFLVLDDVNEKEQLDAILGTRSWFTHGSKIIITTRREDLLTVNEQYQMHKIEKLTDRESFELFNYHAFGQSHPAKGYMVQSQKFVSHCGGIPLALEVLGGSVSGRSLDVWESALKKLDAQPHMGVVEKLKISYVSLQDEYDKSLFLDIACFFVGKKKNDLLTILDGCNYHTADGIQSLIDRNLLIVENDRIGMHPLLQEMGKQIVREESILRPEERSRLWQHQESFDVLNGKIGTDRIEGMILDMNMVKRSKSRRNSKEEVLEANTFEKMRNLRLLKISHIQLSGTYEVLPRKIRWLYWHGFHLNYLPSGFPLENLVALEMSNSSLKQLWKATKVLESLKVLILSHSTKLVKTPDFSSTPNLEKLVLKDCPHLVEVDESIVNLERLIFVNLSDCKNLRKLPRNIGMVKSLEQLIISGCSNLVGVAIELEKMKSLRVFKADRMEISQTLSEDTFPAWYNLIPCITKPCENPKISWGSLPSSLVTLTLMGSNMSDDSFPKNLGSTLPMLKHLYLGGNPIRNLPEFVRNLGGLEKLDFSWCTKLQQIIWPSIDVQELIVTECHSLKQITNETSSGMARRISHGACLSLDYVERGFKIEAVAKVDREVLKNFGFFELVSMETVKVMIVNEIVWSKKKCPIQIIYEFGVFSTYFPGREVPHWFNLRTAESTISFTIPSDPSLKLRGLNLCLLYTLSETDEWILEPISVQIKNTITGEKFKYEPRCYGISEVNGDIVWLSHWYSVLWEYSFKEGDKIEVSFYMNTFLTKEEKVEGQIKGCGVQILYFEDDMSKEEYFKTLYHSWDSRMNIFHNTNRELEVRSSSSYY